MIFWTGQYNCAQRKSIGEVAEIELQIFNKAQKMIEEQKPNNSTETAILPMQCYVPCGLELNKIYNESNLETMARMPDNFVNLTVASPPYDGLRTYNGYSFPFEDIAQELYRITKQGGVLVWIVADGTVNGSRTGTSFKQALYFMGIGFNLHQRLFYEKAGPPPDPTRYEETIEEMFVFSKGKPKTINLIKSNKSSKRSKQNSR